MKSNKLIVMSVDALLDEDMNFMKALPNFSRIFHQGAYVKGGVRGIYPALTYPCHASMITGTYPDKHGIFHNEILNPKGGEMDWYWYRDQIKVPTIIDKAHEAGLTTACLGWPCMGADPASDWMIPEIWPKRGADNLEEILERSASPNVMNKEGALRRYLHIYRKLGRQFVDQAVIKAACRLIKTEQPDVMFLHVAYLDYMRHIHGVHGAGVETALTVHDDWLGWIAEAVEEAGLTEKTNFAVVSDHGHLPVKQMFQPNVLLVQRGLIRVDENGKVLEWKAWCNSASLSAQVHLKDPKDFQTREKIEEILYEMRENPQYGVEAVFGREQLKEDYHLTGTFDYVLEGKAGTSFGNSCTGSILIKPDNSDYKFSLSSHGHLPYKGAQPVWVMKGPDVGKNKWVNKARLIDLAPTFAQMLGLEMPEAEGTCIWEMLKTEG
ncbi:MAG: ectonucleotide pyrophosphatase/phosphodiesterase [Candidatus Saccharibacteria bacterium]|nr:ectonucleotide pyrophosphatase/phosphodiesterase [Candidatus Saccharibacteria bacterium]